MGTTTSHKLLAAATITLAMTGCAHKAGPGVHHGNELLLNGKGTLHFGHLNAVNKCGTKFNDGEVELSWPNGKKRVTGTCAGGLMVGSWKAWYNNGATVWKAKFEDGRIVSTFKSYHPDGEKLSTIEFDGGAPDGDFKSWWANGEVRAKGEYVGGKENGCWETWHDNGQKASKGTYADGKKVLAWLTWTASGKKSKQKFGGEAAHGRCLVTF